MGGATASVVEATECGSASPVHSPGGLECDLPLGFDEGDPSAVRYGGGKGQA